MKKHVDDEPLVHSENSIQSLPISVGCAKSTAKANAPSTRHLSINPPFRSPVPRIGQAGISASLPIRSNPITASSNRSNNQPTPLPKQVPKANLDTEPKLCKEQQDLVDLILSGCNVFYTGSAGCGKSTVLKTAVRLLQHEGKKVCVIAPTGRAALQVDGMSTWSYMGWTPDFHKYPLQKLKKQGFRAIVRDRLKKTEVLIIDEISMVENHHLERINACMKEVRCWNDVSKKRADDAPAFGGVQVIVTGDFCQLPPVKPFQFCMDCGREMAMSDDGSTFDCPKNHGPFNESEKWAFKSAAWEEAKFTHIHLEEIHRQNDNHFIRLLQKCRLGIPFSQDEADMLMDHPCNVDKATRLLCTRREVGKVNSENFRKMKTPVYDYNALDDFECNQEDHSELSQYTNRNPDGTLPACKDHRLDPALALRGGMLVILQMNLDIKRGLVNGSQGIICGFEKFDPAVLTGPRGKYTPIPGYQIIGGEYADIKEQQILKFMETQETRSKQKGSLVGTVWPRVLFHNGKKLTVYASCVVNSVGDKEPYSLLHRTQIPLTAGWATSVHKSQGMTLDRVIVDLSRAFEEGQVYVALSRATSLEGLRLEGSSSGLWIGVGGNDDVQQFLRDKFGDRIFLN